VAALLIALAGACEERADFVIEFTRGGVSGNVNVWVCAAGSSSADHLCSFKQVFEDDIPRSTYLLGIFVDDDSEAIDLYIHIQTSDFCRVMTLPTVERLELSVQLGPDSIEADCDCVLEVCTIDI
jgi:hypothetical protein